jgi:hypothetical protein
MYVFTVQCTPRDKGTSDDPHLETPGCAGSQSRREKADTRNATLMACFGLIRHARRAACVASGSGRPAVASTFGREEIMPRP